MVPSPRPSAARSTWLLVYASVGLVFSSLLLASLPASAQRGRTRVRTAEVRRLLDAEAPRDVLEGLEKAGVSGSPQMVPLISGRIRRGLTPELLDIAIDTLAVLARPEAGPVLFELARHRRAEIRLRAIEAIVACEAPRAEPVLLLALADSEPTIRASAALALGTLGSDQAIAPLFVAFERGVPEAATALGQRVRPTDLERLTAFLGRRPFDVLAPAFTEVLTRTDITERAKMDLIAAIEALGTAEARAFLEELVSTLPAEAPHITVREAARAATERIAQ